MTSFSARDRLKKIVLTRKLLAERVPLHQLRVA
jgi:DNA-binding TFAR19-related protein (PDSD5 family)